MIRISVPASSANLGPGFDCLGLALDWRNEVWLSEAAEDILEVEGEGSEEIGRDGDNLVLAGIKELYRFLGKERPPVRLRLVNRFPIGRGLGSSAAAVVGGLVAANELLGRPVSEIDIFRLASRLDGHPDNVAPALAGGLTVTWGDDFRRYAPPPLHLTLAIPERPLDTSNARRILPEMVPRSDAVFNLQRVALWLTALQRQQWELLGVATEDRLHQPYREALLPGLRTALEAAIRAGALAAVLSGSGSTVLAFSRETSPRIDEALRGGLAQMGPVKIRHLAASADGARREGD